MGRIIDCGANIGCSAFYFLSKYPDAELIAIEPDEGNFPAPTEKPGGIWKASSGPSSRRLVNNQRLRVDRGHFGDGMEWSLQVACVPR
jgi:hypothetical protein